MNWEDDYIQLSQLLAGVGEKYKKETGKTDFTLDLEYKKIAPEGKLVIKQVREIPRPDTTPGIVPFLVQDADQRGHCGIGPIDSLVGQRIAGLRGGRFAVRPKEVHYLELALGQFLGGWSGHGGSIASG